MVIGLVIIGLLIALIPFGRVRVTRQFSEAAQLFSSWDVSSKKFSHAQLAGLPKPVARYSRHVLKEGQSYISTVKLTHDELFKNLKKKWIKIKGMQYFTSSPPGFTWKGTTSLFTAHDLYIHDKGRLMVLYVFGEHPMTA